MELGLGLELELELGLELELVLELEFYPTQRSSWHHDMETLSVLLDLYEGNRVVPNESLLKGLVIQSFHGNVLISFNMLEQTVRLPIISDAMILKWRHYN